MQIERINKRGQTIIAEGELSVRGVVYRDGAAFVQIELPAAGATGYGYLIEISVQELAECATHTPVGRLPIDDQVYLEDWGIVNHELASHGVTNAPLGQGYGVHRCSPSFSGPVSSAAEEDADFAGGLANDDPDTLSLPLEEDDADR